MRIAFQRAGAGPALLLLHALGGDRHAWDPVVPALAAQRTVLTVDLPGFGESPPLTGVPPTPSALADAVAELVTGLRDEGTLGAEPVHVAGNSLGGWVALELGLAGAAASVTGIAPAGMWSRPLVPKASLGHRVARALEPVAIGLVSSQAGRRALLAGSVAHPERVPAADARRMIRAYARAPGFVAVNDAMRAGHFTALDRIRVPVTLAWCEHDRLVQAPERVPPSVRMVRLADAGHVPMWDAPAEVAAVLLEGSAGVS